MAFVRKTVRNPATGFDRISIGLGGIIRWVAVPGIGLAFAAWCLAIVAGLNSAASLASAGSFVPHTLPPHARIAPGDPVKHGRVAKVAPPAAQPKKSERLALAADAPLARVPLPAKPSPQDGFEKLVARAELSQDKVLAAFIRAGMTVTDTARSTELALSMPIEERFYLAATETGPLPDRFGPIRFEPETAEGSSHLTLALARQTQVELAYAMPEPSSGEAAWDSFARWTQEPADDGSDATDATAEGLPDSVRQPASRPKPDASPSPKQAKQPARPAPEALAYARPDKPAGGIAGAFSNLFNAPGRGDGVAVYDISAGTVYMPDGTRLEAHSGIGKMADNPRFVHVKMNGPTPPNTYKLSMRETRFYGVEAIRMTPIGGGEMHGRNGILAHSYLLRGGRAESHGCVAFKDYPRFLKAFKQGKVKQIVVRG